MTPPATTLIPTGLSRAASVMNLRNNSQPDDTLATDDLVCVKTSMTSLRFFLSSARVSAEDATQKFTQKTRMIMNKGHHLLKPVKT